MGVPLNDEIVVIQKGKYEGDTSLVTINCPDKLGLGCDLTRIFMDFNLDVVGADMSTDGKWCFGLFWVTSRDGSIKNIRWIALKRQLTDACPSPRPLMQLLQSSEPKPKITHILQTSTLDRSGLLNDIARTFWELQITIQKLKATTTPDGKALNIYYLTDTRGLLKDKKNEDQLYVLLRKVTGDSTGKYELKRDGPEWGGLDYTTFSSIPSFVEDLCLKGPSESAKISISIDNSLSPRHTLLKISCNNHKGLLYDCLRTLKDFQMEVAYGRFTTNDEGAAEMELFISQRGGKKLLDPQKQESLFTRLKMGISHPVQVMVVNRGPDTELLVAAPIQMCGLARPRVLCDTTFALNSLGISIFKADVECYHLTGEGQSKIYRFLLVEKFESDASSSRIRSRIAQEVRNKLMG